MQNKTKVSIPKPEYIKDLKLKHKHLVELINLESSRLSEASEVKREHNLVIELCCALILFQNIYSYILTLRTVL